MDISEIKVINLKRHPERWELWVKEAQRVGIQNYDRWEGIDGQQLEMNSEILDLLGEHAYKLKKGELGCALTHISLWQYVLKNQIPALLVFEDDARFSSPFKIPEIIPANWELFYLGGAGNIKDVYPPGYRLTDEVTIPKFTPNLYFTGIAYVVSYLGAIKLMKKLKEEKINHAIDRVMSSWFDQMHVYCCKKLIVYPGGEYGSSTEELL